MELIDAIALIFLALMIGWVGLVLGATWLQVRDERARLGKNER